MHQLLVIEDQATPAEARVRAMLGVQSFSPSCAKTVGDDSGAASATVVARYHECATSLKRVREPESPPV